MTAPLILSLALTTALVPPQEKETRREVEGVPPDAIRVLVVDDTGRPLAGARVARRAMTREREDEPRNGVLALPYTWSRTITTDSSGVVLLEDLEEGHHRIAAGSLPLWSFSFSEPLEGGAAVTIALTAVPRERALSGVVLGPDGVPARAAVRFVWNDGGRTAQAYAGTVGGRFVLLADRPGREGALIATVRGHGFGSAVIDPVRAGSDDIVLRLREAETLTLDLSNQHGPLEHATVKFAWHLAGTRFEEYPARREERGARFTWEVPSVPFYVSVGARDHEPVELGPLDPSEVGSRLAIQLEAHPRVHGRVAHAGSPVEGARVQLRVGEEWRDRATTDATGRFDFALQRAGTYALRAWSGVAGEGFLGPLDIDPLIFTESLEIEITRAPGAIAGQVLLPVGRGPGELWLTTGTTGLWRLGQDGSFAIERLPAGPTRIYVRERTWPDSNLGDSLGPYWFSHGPDLAPSWLRPEPTFDVVVRPGMTTELVLDLTREPACRLQGSHLVDGHAPSTAEREMKLYFQPPPRLVLSRSDEKGRASGICYASRTEPSPDGTFVLTAGAPGNYVLDAALTLAEDFEWRVRDEVELVLGTTHWTFETSSGVLRCLPKEGEWSFGRVRWRGPDDLVVETEPGTLVEGVMTFPAVPAGTLELLAGHGPAEKVVGTVEVRPGETVTIEAP